MVAGLARHDQDALQAWKRNHQNEFLEQELLQWHLDRQWQRLRRLGAELGVEILGDLPFYVARDSADVWSHRTLFSIAADGCLREQSGVPPDYFSATGQLWGTPVYSWGRHRRTGFRWWRNRLKRQWALVDQLRLDHFRALASYWSVPGRDTTAMQGRWRRSPGAELLALLRRDAGGRLPLVAEDLGVITPDVERLRDRFHLPGMKVLQFAFDGNPNNPYLPANIQGSQWVVYPGTHDNPTSLGWWQQLDEGSRQRFATCLDAPVEAPGWQLLELGMASALSLSSLRCRTCCIWMMRRVSTRRARSVATGTGGWRRWMKPLMVHFWAMGCAPKFGRGDRSQRHPLWAVGDVRSTAPCRIGCRLHLNSSGGSSCNFSSPVTPRKVLASPLALLRVMVLGFSRLSSSKPGAGREASFFSASAG